MALSSTSFKKGHKKVGGRVAGTPNKVDLKDATLRAFDEAGGVEYLKKVATTNPNAFLNFVGKFVPKDVQLSGNDENNTPISLLIRGFNERNNSSGSSSS